MKRRQKKTQTGSLSCENQLSRAPTLFELSGRPHRMERHGASSTWALRGPRTCVCVEILGAGTRRSRWHPPLGADRPEKVTYRTSGMHACGKSDGLIVPAKPSNKGMRPAEVVEGRGPAKGNMRFRTTGRTQCRVRVLFSDPGVREAASAASPPLTRGGSRMREIRSYGSVRGAGGNPSPYREGWLRSSHVPSIAPKGPRVREVFLRLADGPTGAGTTRRRRTSAIYAAFLARMVFTVV
jgi:hypothetical protein